MKTIWLVLTAASLLSLTGLIAAHTNPETEEVCAANGGCTLITLRTVKELQQLIEDLNERIKTLESRKLECQTL